MRRRRAQNHERNDQISLGKCQHLMIIGSLCAVCGNKIEIEENNERDAESRDVETTVNMVGGRKMLLSSEGARMVHEDKSRRLLQSKMLALVLDLDNTLMHATPDPESGKYKGKDCFRFSFAGKNGVHSVKLRPYLMEFLEEASKQYELSIYTAGTREYAETVAHHIDPNNVYFSRRIISACDTIDTERGTKSLSRVFPGSSNMILVLDDREDVWRGEQSKNLLVVRPYIFWKNVPSIENIVENDPQLQCTLKFLREVHSSFYSEKSGEDRDVRVIVQKIRNKILAGITVVFTGVIPLSWKSEAESNPLYQFALLMGAKVKDFVDSTVTHVLSNQMGSEKTLQALNYPACKIVHVDWLMFSVWHCRREDEQQFLLTPRNSSSTLSQTIPDMSANESTSDGPQSMRNSTEGKRVSFAGTNDQNGRPQSSNATSRIPSKPVKTLKCIPYTYTGTVDEKIRTRLENANAQFALSTQPQRNEPEPKPDNRITTDPNGSSAVENGVDTSSDPSAGTSVEIFDPKITNSKLKTRDSGSDRTNGNGSYETADPLRKRLRPEHDIDFEYTLPAYDASDTARVDASEQESSTSESLPSDLEAYLNEL